MFSSSCKQTQLRAVIVIASHDSLRPRTRARVTARPMNRRPDFFLRGRVCHINERALYFLIGVALAAVRILHATERRIWTGAYDPKTKEETAHAAHPESYYQCAHYRSLSLLADVPFASCTSCHVVASLQGRIRRGGATCTPKTRTFSDGIIFDT